VRLLVNEHRTTVWFVFFKVWYNIFYYFISWRFSKFKVISLLLFNKLIHSFFEWVFMLKKFRNTMSYWSWSMIHRQVLWHFPHCFTLIRSILMQMTWCIFNIKCEWTWWLNSLSFSNSKGLCLFLFNLLEIFGQRSIIRNIFYWNVLNNSLFFLAMFTEFKLNLCSIVGSCFFLYFWFWFRNFLLFWFLFWNLWFFLGFHL
jgi:hypothetical protein